MVFTRTSSVSQNSSNALSMNLDRRDPHDNHFRWDSIRHFLYLACAYSNSMHNFDLFGLNPIKVYDVIILEVTIGMSYMFMDFFIKVYTKRIDSAKLLNPLLRGVTYGLFIQSAGLALVQAGYAADTIRFLFGTFNENLPWSQCFKVQDVSLENITCKASATIIYSCNLKEFDFPIYINETSAHFHYQKFFATSERSIMTKRLFLIGLVWIFNFFITSVTDDSLIKILKFAFLYQTVSSIVTMVFIAITAQDNTITAFSDILYSTVSVQNRHSMSVIYITYIYSIGYLGLYDFDTMPSVSKVDNCVVIFSIVFTSLAFLRSWIIRVLYLEMTRCVMISDYHKTVTRFPHYHYYTILPLSAELVSPTMLYIRYIYTNIILNLTAFLAVLTITMTKLLNTEFRSIKTVYLMGILCCIGFVLTLFRTLISTKYKGYKTARGFLVGMDVCTLYLGGLKVALIMWVYGVQRFATDIQYWLGFKPPKFWTISWTVLPIVLWGFLGIHIYNLTQVIRLSEKLCAVSWILLTIIVVASCHIKTITKYLFLNNVAGILSASLKYGPPDSEDRKGRRNFDEIMHLRQCKHNCHAIDDMVECNHLPLTERNISSVGSSSILSLTSVYENKEKKQSTTTLEIVSY